ncbi:MFS transporter [Undibacterium cyanobacteriorum]|uniref:MFS transporter n=1 Tax=Undibacterium cyanobacteriorum TaxID=3073561 RepID=A0ABY9RFH8_9BURK|nr:MFS transporter [Undibacterium sp. 20NA77.5]WMW79983.1 MFS transporter [Undibacterium sp. 20NA77.5]
MKLNEKPAIPKSIWTLGFVSLLMDISSEMIHSLLPVFMVGSLGMSVMLVGLLDGIAEATTLIVKIFSGALSDRLGKRKILATLGYGLSALSKPLFALATNFPILAVARMGDRIGKGIRGAPRDALIADITPPEIRGAAFGLRQSLDTIGAVGGPLIATGLMILWANDFRSIFWIAVIPALASLLLLMFGVQEPRTKIKKTTAFPLSRAQLNLLPRSYWTIVSIGGLFTLARFSEAFLLLRAQQLNVSMSLVPLIMVAMNAVYALTAYPFGKLSDRVSPYTLLQYGLLVLIAADLCLASTNSLLGLACGIILWGIHMGMTQGLLSSLISQFAPTDLRGTAFGMFNLVSGICLLLASFIAGALWETLGAQATFWAGVAIAIISLVAVGIFARKHK